VKVNPSRIVRTGNEIERRCTRSDGAKNRAAENR
jgi:hypothetical protein